jgi:surface protein
MYQLFAAFEFNGDISRWDVSNVENMNFIFQQSTFNGDISKWDVSKVKNMGYMFDCAWNFNSDLSHWKPVSLEVTEYMYNNCKAPIPYWAEYENIEARRSAIENYWLEKELSKELEKNNNQEKRIKI